MSAVEFSDNFSIEFKGLVNDTKYFYRAYVNTSEGFFYGSVEAFVTKTVVPATALTPNGDGINDTWVIPGIENFPNSTVKVFNRSGHPVFSAKGYMNNWKGNYRSHSELPAGSYYYSLDLGNGNKPLTGWIFINY